MTLKARFNKIRPISVPGKPSTCHYIADHTKPQKTITTQPSHHDLNTLALTTTNSPANPSDPTNCNDPTQGTTQFASKNNQLPKMGTRLSSIKPATCKIIQKPCNLAQQNGVNPTVPQKSPEINFNAPLSLHLTNHTVPN